MFNGPAILPRFRVVVVIDAFYDQRRVRGDDAFNVLQHVLSGGVHGHRELVAGMKGVVGQHHPEVRIALLPGRCGVQHVQGRRANMLRRLFLASVEVGIHARLDYAGAGEPCRGKLHCDDALPPVAPFQRAAVFGHTLR